MIGKGEIVVDWISVQQKGWIAANFKVFCEVCHVAVSILGKPTFIAGKFTLLDLLKGRHTMSHGSCLADQPFNPGNMQFARAQGI